MVQPVKSKGTPMRDPMNRREFIRNTGILGAGLAGLTGAAADAPRAAPPRQPAGAADPAAKADDRSAEPPSRQVVIGVMGLGRGMALASGFARLPGARVKYLCDVDDERLAKATKDLAAKSEGGDDKCETVKDFRRILDDREVDVLVIAGPDHWHAPATILACAAGKHVYVEKPCSHNPREGEWMVAAARKHNRVVQHGTQRRSAPKVIEAVEKVRSGAIGKVLYSRGWYAASRGTIGRGKPAPVPAGLDYSLWQGPAPEREFRDNYLHYTWHWFWHWGTGELGNNGVHALDVCRWGLGVDYPLKVTAGGGRYYFDDDQETPDTHVVSFDFGDKGMIMWEGQSCHPRGIDGSGFGISFHGDEGTLLTNGTRYHILDKKGKEVAAADGSGGDREHLQDFIDRIRDNGNGSTKPSADIEEGHKSTLLCHLGNIAYRTGRTLACDPETGRIRDGGDAQALWGREYRKGWEPKV